MKRVKKFGVYQTAKVAAVICFLLTAVVFIPMFGIMSMISGSSDPSPLVGFFVLLTPFKYGLFGFIFTAIGCLLYNLISKWTGGIELEFETTEEHTE